jgi:phosphoribulokinase
MISVGGDSGTGKTTLCRGIFSVFGSEIVELCLDDYHSLDRAQRKSIGITALDPRANNFAAMEEDLWRLREGYAIDKPVYDHSDGTIGGPEHVEPKDIVIVQGLFPLYTRALREMFDVTVWLDPEPELKVNWKIQRDTTQRGYSESEVRAEIARRQPDIEKHIAPQAAHADLIVRFRRPADWEAHRDNARLDASIRKNGRFKPLDYSEFSSSATAFRVEKVPSSGAYPATMIELDGHVDDETAAAIQNKIWSHMDSHAHLRSNRLGEFADARGPRVSHTLALAQLLIARRVVLVENELSAAVAS